MKNGTCKVDFQGKSLEFPYGTSYRDVAAALPGENPAPVMAVLVNGRLQELREKLKDDVTLSLVTGADSAGHKIYVRTAIFIMLKAIYDLYGKKEVSRTYVHFSLDNGLYITVEGREPVSEEYLCAIREKMREIVAEDHPITKRSLKTQEARELFRYHGMYEKDKLFQCRRSSWVNIYSLKNFDDYYYGYMADTTGAIPVFDLIPYGGGFMLLLPRRSSPDRLEAFRPREKLFRSLMESENWGRDLNIAAIGDLNNRIINEGVEKLVLVQEALHEGRISAIARQIKEREGVKFVMIAGPSSSGKTTFSHRLSIQLTALGLRPHPIALDDYFLNREDTPLDEYGEKDYESIRALDVEGFNRDMTALLEGKEVAMPTFNFVTGKREYKGNTLCLGEEDILVIEGIHGLNDELSHALPLESKFKIYISALTSLNVDEHNWIPTTDLRLIRRIVRDARTRGNTAAQTIARWDSVRRGEEKNIFPYQEEADVFFNSSLVYELAVLKISAEPLLFGIEDDASTAVEARRLLKFLDYFLAVSESAIPNNSILKEFIGGSCFEV